MKTYFYSIILFITLYLSGCTIGSVSLSKLEDKTLNNLENKIYLLDGKWEFYWKELLNPDDFIANQNLPSPLLVNIPDTWTSYKDENGNPIPRYGYATYRLVANIPDSVSSLHYGLYIPKIWCAAKVWINGKLIYQAGKVGFSPKDFKNEILEGFEPIYNLEDRLEIVVQVTNYDLFVSSGLLKNFVFGKYDKVYTSLELKNALNLAWIGCIFIMGIYHFILFSLRKKGNYSTLYFGLICTAITFSWLFFGDHFFYEFIKEVWQVGYATQSKIYFISIFSIVPLGLWYLNCIYRKEMYKKMPKIATLIFGIYSIFILFTSPVIFTITIPFFFIILTVFLFYLFGVLIWAAIRKRKEWKAQMIGMITMAFSGVNDALATRGIELTGELETLPYALGTFLIVQMYVLAKHFSDAFNSVEDLSLNLEKKVVERTEEVRIQKTEIENKNKKLEKALENITGSVRYASRLQRALLGEEKSIEKKLKNSFVLYLPRDIVSGDFFLYETVISKSNENNSNPTKVLIAADCTGHGVPGALMTILGNSFLHEIIKKDKITSPNQILYQLDEKIIKAFSDSNSENPRNDGMDVSVLLMDESKKELHFSGAKNPLYYIRNGEISVIKGSKFPIGSFQFKVKKEFQNHIIPIQKDDIFYIFSDGYSDQFGGKDAKKKYMTKHFKETLLTINNLPMDQQKDALLNNFHQWKGDHPQTDDVLVIGFRV